MTWSFYDPSTGIFSGKTFSGPEHALELNTPKGLSAMKGLFDQLCQRVNQAGEIVEFQPPQPSTNHQWDVESKRWVKKPEIAQAEARAILAKQRIAALELDQAGPLREFVLSGNEISRKKLLDIEKEIATLRELQ